MDVWATWMHKVGKCQYPDCSHIGRVINCREPIIRTKQYNPKFKTVSVRSYHFDCWVKQAREYLESSPYVPRIGDRGSVPDEFKEERLKLQQRRASLNQRKRLLLGRYKNSGKVVSKAVEEKIAWYDEQMAECSKLIYPLGGIPEGWLVQESKE